MGHEILKPESWGRPSGYSNGVKTEAGRLIAVAGQIAWDARQQLQGRDDFTVQFDQALANVVSVVEAAGGQAQHIVKLTIFVVDRQSYLHSRRDLAPIYRRRMGLHFPAMTLVEVKGLLEEGALVEIDALAVIP